MISSDRKYEEVKYKLLKQSTYACLFTENNFLRLLPVAISTDDSSKYRKDTNFESSTFFGT
jgi:hypothetical protein